MEKIKIAKETMHPLYQKGDKFEIIKLNSDPDLVPIIAKRLKTGDMYGFYEGELE